MKTVFSKNIVVAILIAALLIVVTVYWQKPKDAKDTGLESIVVKQPDDNVLSEDSDGDRVPDWQEILRGTDPNNPDTDNDGVSDFDEQNSEDLITDEDFDIKTKTDEFARQFFSTFVALQQSGNLSGEAIVELSNSLSSELEEEIADEYSVDDLNTVGNTPSRKLNYQSDIIEALVGPYQNGLVGDELEIFIVGLQDSSENVAKVLETRAILYQEITEDLLTIETPGRIAPIHIDITNAYNRLSVSTANMAEFIDDPFMSLIGFNQYIETNEEVGVLIDQIISYLN